MSATVRCRDGQVLTVSEHDLQQSSWEGMTHLQSLDEGEDKDGRVEPQQGAPCDGEICKRPVEAVTTK